MDKNVASFNNNDIACLEPIKHYVIMFMAVGRKSLRAVVLASQTENSICQLFKQQDSKQIDSRNW